MATARTTISLDGEIYSAALAACAPEKENRDFSNLCEQALREYLKARGALPGDDALTSEVLALAKEVGLAAALETLRRKLRAKSPAAA